MIKFAAKLTSVYSVSRAARLTSGGPETTPKRIDQIQFELQGTGARRGATGFANSRIDSLEENQRKVIDLLATKAQQIDNLETDLGEVEKELKEIKAFQSFTGMQDSSDSIPLVSNVVTHSTRCDDGAGYAPVELTVGTTMYCDRDYIFTSLPDFLDGTTLIQTSNSDKHSDPADSEWVCFDVSESATVYLLYDSRVELNAEPDWLTSMFAGQHLSGVEMLHRTFHTTKGSMNVWVYYTGDASETVCLGGNGAPSNSFSNYLVAVGPAQVHPQIASRYLRQPPSSTIQASTQSDEDDEEQQPQKNIDTAPKQPQKNDDGWTYNYCFLGHC